MKRLTFTFLLLVTTIASYSQIFTDQKYDQIVKAPEMFWHCPEIDNNMSLLYSLSNDDYKIYAENVKKRFPLKIDESNVSEKFIATTAIFTIESPLYKSENLLNHVASWLQNQNGLKIKKINLAEHLIDVEGTINVATHPAFFSVYKISISPLMSFQLIDENKMLVSFWVDRYINEEYSDGRCIRSFNPKISDVFPFVPKSAYKTSYAKGYVGTYLYFWDLMKKLSENLNTNFRRDNKLLSQLHYEYSKDSLYAKYGEPTNIIRGNNLTPDVNNELRFYANMQKVVFMGKTINFKDVISCEIKDDPQLIPGHTSSYIGGISFWGFELGGAETSRTPDKTIHNYVVNVKIDDLSAPSLHIVTGHDAHKAEEIASAFEYIIRHKQSKEKNSDNRNISTRKRNKK